MGRRLEWLVGKMTGAGLAAVSVGFFAATASGGIVNPAVGLLPALGFGATGLWLLIRRDTVDPALPPGASDEVLELKKLIAHVATELENTQAQLARLEDERAFMDQLLRERSKPAAMLPQQSEQHSSRSD